MKRYEQNEIEKIATILKNDGIISVPTDTVYGICARTNSRKAYDNLVKVKNRPSTKSFPVLCKDLEQIESIATLDERACKLIKDFMPGPLTLVLKKRPDAFTYINNAGARETDEIAVRMISSIFLNELIEKVGSPLFLTSANKSGMDVCRSLDEIEEECPTLDGMVMGDVSFGEASTIVDLTHDDIKIQRQGPISEEEIMNVLKK